MIYIRFSIQCCIGIDDCRLHAERHVFYAFSYHIKQDYDLHHSSTNKCLFTQLSHQSIHIHHVLQQCEKENQCYIDARLVNRGSVPG